MSSQEEELKKYLAKRERKKNRQNVVEYKEEKPSYSNGQRDPESFITYFHLCNGQSRLIITAFISGALCIGIAVFLGMADVDRASIFFTCLFTFVLINLIFIGTIYSGLAGYRKFSSGKDSPVSGWRQFVAGRSDGFWTGSYANVGIKFDQDYQVSDLEKKALNAFTQTWINEWGHRYKGYKWTYGAPKEFNRTGADRIEGHVNLSNVPFLMDQLRYKLPDLLKLLTPGSLQVSIYTIGSDLSTSIDDADEREEERRSDQRHREMMQRED